MRTEPNQLSEFMEFFFFPLFYFILLRLPFITCSTLFIFFVLSPSPVSLFSLRLHPPRLLRREVGTRLRYSPVWYQVGSVFSFFLGGFWLGLGLASSVTFSIPA